MSECGEVYTERSRLLALLSCHYPAHLQPVNDAEPGFDFAVCIHIDGHPATWHISEEDRERFFRHLMITRSHYDGHTTKAKHSRIEATIAHMTRWRKEP